MTISPAAIEVIQAYEWPGNIRQLANTLERAAILEEGSVIQPESLLLPDASPATHRSVMLASGQSTSLEATEKQMIMETLASCLWIQKDAADRLGISPRALNYKIKKFGITHPRWRKHKA
jgi:DNA-binding NtrC family response regulator